MPDAAAPLVLLVDDSPLVTDALGVLLEATGHRVTGAASVGEAVAAARREPPAAVLLDLTLPDGEGLDVLTQLRASGAPVPPTLALTGHDDAETARRCLDAGCRGVLVKPVGVGALLAALREVGVAPAP